MRWDTGCGDVMADVQGTQITKRDAVEESESSNSDDYRDYLADMILELRTMALKSGRAALAAQLLVAYDVSRGEGQVKS